MSDELADEVRRLRAELTAARERIGELETFAEFIRDDDWGWRMRSEIETGDVIVRDDGRHFKVGVLHAYGRRAARLLANPEGKEPAA